MLGAPNVCSQPCMLGAQECVSYIADNTVSILGMYATQVI